jgi:hypothetical protein
MKNLKKITSCSEFNNKKKNNNMNINTSLRKMKNNELNNLKCLNEKYSKNNSKDMLTKNKNIFSNLKISNI